jgi:hypothetical protein
MKVILARYTDVVWLQSLACRLGICFSGAAAGSNPGFLSPDIPC